MSLTWKKDLELSQLGDGTQCFTLFFEDRNLETWMHCVEAVCELRVHKQTKNYYVLYIGKTFCGGFAGNEEECKSFSLNIIKHEISFRTEFYNRFLSLM